MAAYDVDFKRKGPGLLLRDILRGNAEDVLAAQRIIVEVSPDILFVTGIDYDFNHSTLHAFAKVLKEGGTPYAHLFTAMPNAGMQTGLDMNGDGRTGTARDAQGYGRYAGAEGMAILSKYPIDNEAVRDFSGLIWVDLPFAKLPSIEGQPFPSQAARNIQRLSTTAHWDVPIQTPDGVLHLLAYSATPPVFDGPENMNGLRGADETNFWVSYLDGELPDPPSKAPFVVVGKSNIDPLDGDGKHEAMHSLLRHPRVNDPKPTSVGGRQAADAGHLGDPSLDTAAWFEEEGGPKNLRVDYVLPSRDLVVSDSGVFWPAKDAPLASLVAEGEMITRHRLVWVDITLP